ncbi:MAG: DNA alkylation repair protein [Saprospiraceae bacterium]|nr:DNA alkylation repair protein [Candidatus Brachybacter algidus]
MKRELEFIIAHKSWWDTVDYIASTTVGWAYKEGFISLQDIESWNKSPDMWLN